MHGIRRTGLVVLIERSKIENRTLPQSNIKTSFKQGVAFKLVMYQSASISNTSTQSTHDLRKTEKKNHIKYAAPEGHQVRPESLDSFKPSYASSKVKRGGHWGILETAKPKEKIIQNRKTAKKFGQNRKPHTKPSKTDTMVI